MLANARALLGIGVTQNTQGKVIQKISDTQDEHGVVLAKILALLEVPPDTVSIDRLIEFRGQTLQGVDTLQIKDNEQFTLILSNPKDAKGQPSQIDPSKTKFVIDSPVATLTPGADGLTCLVQGATVGSSQVSGSVTDANNADDVILFTPVHLDVIGSDTKTIDVSTGPVTVQDAPTGGTPTP